MQEINTAEQGAKLFDEEARQQTGTRALARFWAKHALDLRNDGKEQAALALAWRAVRHSNFEDALTLAALGSIELTLGHIGYADAHMARSVEEAQRKDAGVSFAQASEIEHLIGLVKTAEGDYNTAIQHINKAAGEGNEAAAWDKAVTLLLMGDWINGFREYERRMGHYRYVAPDTPLWFGTYVPVLWVICEQGDGDIFMLARYLTWASQHCDKLIFSVHPHLHSLFLGFPGVSELRVHAPTMPEPEDATAMCWMASLPYLHGSTTSHIPFEPQWFKHVAGLPTVNIFAPRGNLKVGLVWAGSPTHERDRDRSIPLEDLLFLTGIPNVTVFSFQVGERQKDIARLGATDLMVDVSPKLTDWLMTAAALKEMDLLISVDTAAAHIAGCLAVPTWLLLSKVPDWRWLASGATSVWYPNTLLFRQRTSRQWKFPISEIQTSLTMRLKLPINDDALKDH